MIFYEATRRILSPLRLPFRHIGAVLVESKPFLEGENEYRKDQSVSAFARKS